MASRGSMCLMDNSLWWHGPAFLQQVFEITQTEDDTPLVPESDPELKRMVNVTKTVQVPTMIDRLARFSDWFRAKRAVALCLRFLQLCKRRSRIKFPQKPLKKPNPTQRDLHCTSYCRRAKTSRIDYFSECTKVEF